MFLEAINPAAITINGKLFTIDIVLRHIMLSPKA